MLFWSWWIGSLSIGGGDCPWLEGFRESCSPLSVLTVSSLRVICITRAIRLATWACNAWMTFCGIKLKSQFGRERNVLFPIARLVFFAGV